MSKIIVVQSEIQTFKIIVVQSEIQTLEHQNSTMLVILSKHFTGMEKLLALSTQKRKKNLIVDYLIS